MNLCLNRLKDKIENIGSPFTSQQYIFETLSGEYVRKTEGARSKTNYEYRTKR